MDALEIRLEDECTKIFLNPYGKGQDISEELKEFLEYLVTRDCNSEFTKRLDDEVWAVVENEEWRLEYMTLKMRDRENLERGLATGRNEGESRVNTLNLKLAEAGREAEIVKAATDKAYQEKLFKEFDL